ncbi:PAS domain-containing protein [Oxalobacteraceae bacterium A2-2]
MTAETPSRLPSIRAQIALLVLACALPTLIAFGAVVRQFYLHERSALRLDSLQAARAVAAAVDRDLAQAQGAALALSFSPSLRGGDLGALRQQGANLLGPQFPASQFLLSDSAGRLAMQAGGATPVQLTPERNAVRLRALYAQGRPQLSLIHAGGAPLLAVDVPVYVDGRLAYALSAVLKADRLARILEEEQVAAQQAVALYDGDGVLVAQRGAAFGAPGTPAAPARLAQFRRQPEGLLDSEDGQAQAIYLGHSRAPVSGATVAVATPQSYALASLLQSITHILLAAGVVLVAGFGLAWSVGGRVARSARALLEPAAALSAGRGFTLEPMAFREAEAVARALRVLEADLQRHRHGLESLVAERTVQLEKSRAQVETLYAKAPVGLSYVDSELRIIRINEFLAALNGVPVSDHLGRYAPDMIADQAIRAGVLEDYRTVLRTGRGLAGVERAGRSPGGQVVHWVMSYYPQFDADGKLSAITGLVQDITTQKRTIAELRQSRQLFQSVVENMPVMLFVKRATDFSFEMFNRYGLALLGRSRQDLAGKNDYDIMPGELADRYRQDDLRVLASQEAVEIGIEPVLDAAGQTRYLATSKVALRDERGQPTHVMGISIDITERRRAEEDLRATSARLAESEQFVRTITDNLPGMVAYWDAGLRCRFANRFFLEWHDLSAELIQGALMADVLGEHEFARSLPYVESALAGQPQGFGGQLAWPSGAVSHTWINYIPDVAEQGRVRGFFVLVSDVTDLKETQLHLQELNEELVRARDRAEAGSRAKSEFLANMSHEIRTPMNAIIGLARLMQEAPLAPRERGYLNKMQGATQQLLGLVNDLLDFSRVEADQLVLEHLPFQLEQVFDGLGAQLAALAWDKGLEPVFDLDPALPHSVRGDPVRLRQVLLKLLHNAIKFTERGQVVVAARPLAEDDHGQVVLEFAVRDTGIGIAPGEQERIFAAFAQADSGANRQYGGAGMGLAIAQRLAGLMGGTIAVHSRPGHGAEFVFRCPLERDPGPALPPAAPPALSLLVVDDNPAVRRAVLHACAMHGWQAEAAASVAEALDLLRAAVWRQRGYDLVLLDHALPAGASGALLRQLKSEAGLDTPVLLMAPEPLCADLAAQQQPAVAGVLAKPVTPARLLRQVLAQRGVLDGAGSAPPLAGRLAGMRILLVEDNEINQEVAQFILEHAGATVELAANGQLAVERLRQAPQRYHAVLMDVQMPVMNGYDATIEIRRQGALGLPALLSLPVIAMTANVMEDDLQDAARAGMTAHIAKPIDIENLVATLQRHAGSAVAPAEPATASAAAIATPPPQATAAGALPGIDMAAALQRLGGQHDALLALLRRFRRSQGGAVDEARGLLAAGRRQEAAQVLHRLRGVAANLGATEVARHTALAEAALRAGDPALDRTLAGLGAALAVVLEGAAPEDAATLESGALDGAALDGAALDGAATGGAGPHGGAAAGPAAALAPGLRAGLAELHGMLQQNNLKALDQFQQLRAGLAAGTAAALAEAIDTLNFKAALNMVETILQQEASA